MKKKWPLISIAVILTAIVVAGITVILRANAPIAKIEEQASQFAVQEKFLATVTDAYTYNGKHAYVTVIGMDENAEEKVVFVPITLEKKAVQEVFLKDGITRKQALTLLQQDQPVNKILHTKLGFEEPGAVWEITYIDDKDALNYVYLRYDDGQWWKRIFNL